MCADAFGMELDAMDWVLFVLQTHDDFVLRLGGDLETRWQICRVDHEAVIADRFEAVCQSLENALVRMKNFARFTVHAFRRAYYFPAVCLADGLVAEANAENWNLPLVSGDEIKANTGLVGVARSW